MEYTVSRLCEQNAAAVARLYGESYRQLSVQYKKPEEMTFYTPDYFKAKVKAFLKEKESSIFVLSQGDDPVGFVRYSSIPAAYRQPGVPLVVQPETGTLDGVRYHFDREIDFSKPTALTRETMALNQIYFDPRFQRQGLGRALLAATLPLMNRRYKDMIVEYNTNNTYARDFYESIGFQQIATTYDLDHIINRRRYYSPVGIGHTDIRNSVNKLMAWNIGKHKINFAPSMRQERTHAD